MNKEAIEGNVVYTKECRACFDKGMCGEAVTQKTRYLIVNNGTRLVAKCLDYEDTKELKDLKSFGLAWQKKGYEIEVIE